jgi:NAD(P)-dependent dehydrogenase (short-subunit alcohol dehydrogenase family)
MAMIGGTNGIGRALARLFTANGADVVVVGRTFRDQALNACALSTPIFPK